MQGKVIKVGNDVDTDQIIASQYLLTTIEDMKQYAFETLIPNFCELVKDHTIIVAGENFGCGSSREQAPSVLKELGVKVIIARSFARIFYRNAINIGLPVVICQDLYANSEEDQEIEVNMEQGSIKTTSGQYECTILPGHMNEILQCGGLINYLNERTV